MHRNEDDKPAVPSAFQDILFVPPAAKMPPAGQDVPQLEQFTMAPCPAFESVVPGSKEGPVLDLDDKKPAALPSKPLSECKVGLIASGGIYAEDRVQLTIQDSTIQHNITQINPSIL